MPKITDAPPAALPRPIRDAAPAAQPAAAPPVATPEAKGWTTGTHRAHVPAGPTVSSPAPVAPVAAQTIKPLGSTVLPDATAPTPTINYNQNVTIKNTGVVKPASLQELKDEIRTADKIRVIGRAHSFNESLHSEGKHLDMRSLNRSEVSPDKKTVWVEAGAISGDFVARLAKEGLALNNAPMHTGVTVGGGLAMASHGTGMATGSFPDEVLEMEVIDSSGNLHRITDPEELKAARTGMGVGGVVYRVKLGLRPNKDMVFEQKAVDPTQIRKTFASEARKNERMDAFYYPGDMRDGKANGAVLRTFNTATAENSAGVKPMNKPANFVKEQILGTVVADKMLSAGVKIAQHTGKLGDWVNDTISKISAKGQGDEKFTMPTSEAAHYFPGHVAVVTMEYSMPLENAEKVWDAIDETIKDTGYVPEMAFYFRCMKGMDKTLLSPSAGRDSVIMESYQFNSKYGADPSKMSPAEQDEMRKSAAFMQSLEKKLVGLGGRSHPGKIFHVEQKSLYPPGTHEKFEAYRAKMDPGGKFMNEWAKGTLGLEQPKTTAASAPVDWASAATKPAAPSSERLTVLNDWKLSAELGMAWKDFQRMQGPQAAAVIKQDGAAQADRLTTLGARLGDKKKELELFVGQGTHSPARTAEAKAAIGAIDDVLHDVALMARPMGAKGLAATQAVAKSLHGDNAVVVSQGSKLELWSRANPASTQKVADLGGGQHVSTTSLLDARGFTPGKVGTHTLDRAPLASSGNLAHLGAALKKPNGSAADLFSKDVAFSSRPDAGPALAAQHAEAVKAAPKEPVDLSVMTYNVALLDVKPFDKQLGGSKIGKAVSGLLEKAAGGALESPDIADRRKALPDAILNGGKDVILLQEVWNPEDVERFQKAAEAKGYVALTTPRDQHTDGLMTLVKKSLIDESQGGIGQRAVTYEQQDTKERVIGSVKRGIQEVRFFHKDLGFVRVANTHAQAYPEHWAERAAQMRTMGLMMADGDPNDVVIGGGDLNAGPYYGEDTHVKKNGDKVGDWYKNGMSYWSLLHYAGGKDAALAGRPASEAQADVTASHTLPTTPGWPHTATNLNEHYAAQYDERAARLDHVVTAGNRQVKVASSAVEFTERRADVGGSLSDHYGVSVKLQVARR